MTVAATTPLIRYIYSGPGDYDYVFRAFEASDIQVTYYTEAGLPIPLVLNTDYTVAIDPDFNGGTVTTTYSPTVGRIAITRDLPFTQEIAWVNQGALSMPLLELSFDKMVMLLQQMNVIVESGAVVLNWRGPWITATTYEAKDVVQAPDGNWYYCIQAHPSQVFTDDLDLGYWVLALDITEIQQIAAEAAQSAAEATAASDSATAAAVDTAADLVQTDLDTIATAADRVQTGLDATATAADRVAAELAAAEAESLVVIGSRSDNLKTDYYVATAGQTAFTITKPASSENIIVFMNSRKLRLTEDYTLNSAVAASVMTLDVAAVAGDEIDIISINTYDLTGAKADLDAAVAATAADLVQTDADTVATAADRVQTGLDRVATAADRVQTGLDAAATAADLVQTNLDTIATAADRVQTGLDLVETAADVVLAEKWAENPEDIAVTTGKYSSLHWAAKASDSYDATVAIYGDTLAVQAAVDAAEAAAVLTAADAAATAADVLTIDSTVANLIAQNEFFRSELIKVMLPEQADQLLTSTTIVDVFLYDTTKDSDGGAWRQRCQSLSWYNEPLNTATRGATREFPAVALIVAESAKVTIYDATVVGCPMWMVFNAGTGSSTAYSIIRGDTLSSVQAKNSTTVVAGDGTGGGLSIIEFIKDETGVRLTTTERLWPHTIGTRNTAISTTVGSYYSAGLVSRDISDVAMTVLDAAPIDADTLLPVPTIAVATAGNSTYGISIIDDGGVAVYDIGADTAGTTYKSVSFDGASLRAVRDDGIVYVWNDVSTIAADGVAADTSYSATTTPALLGTATVVGEKAIGSATGLTIIKPDTTTPANGMVARVTKSYASGFMRGDIRRALLADARKGPVYNETQQITASDAQTSDSFGSSVAVSGNGLVMAVGAPTEDTTAADAGKVYIYDYTGGAWVQRLMLQASDATSGDRFGTGVALSSDGSVLVVGAMWEATVALFSGKVYVYDWNGSSFVERTTVFASDQGGSDRFGAHLALSSDGEVLAVGAPFEGTAAGNAGKVYIFDRSGSSFVERLQIIASDAQGSDFLGSVSLSSDGSVLAVSAYLEDTAAADAGKVYVYDWNGSSFVERLQLTASDAQASDTYGIGLALSSDGSILAVGASGEDTAASAAGKVYVYDWNGSSFVERLQLTASDAAASDNFGVGVAISADGAILVVGADREDTAAADAGKVYVYNSSLTESLTNLVTNGTFDTDTTGWTPFLDAVLSVSGGRLNIQNGTAQGGRVYQSFATTPGKRYRATVDCITATSTLTLAVGLVLPTSITEAIQGTPGQTVSWLFTATNYSSSVILRNDTTTLGDVIVVDNVTVTEVIPDRSVKASTANVIGTLTREPVATGAELQCISGFTTSNYIQQAYSADLDFGTGDFYVMGWLQEAPNSTEEVIVERAYHTGVSYSGPVIRLVVLSTGALRFLISDDGVATYDLITGSSLIDNNTRVFVVAQKKGGSLELWVNAVKNATNVTVVNAVASLNNASASLKIGVRNDTTLPLTNGKLALLRMGAGAPSDAQIAEIYRTELPMFQENAKCTLQSGTDVVTCLDYDERYNRLLVGTTDGAMVFNDLVIDDTFYAKTGNIKAISGGDGNVLVGTTVDAQWDS